VDHTRWGSGGGGWCAHAPNGLAKQPEPLPDDGFNDAARAVLSEDEIALVAGGL
jgi:hypothetical protein